ncbi:Maf-like protein AM1_1059 [Planktothrix agardhii]|jgi:septum formation protein|uniref:Maf family protein n=1 Tax=Planktothrix agardhii TaxID=1160 RepID=UPI001F3D9482|nr:nucleoside triphosphate pyrophosphatase [Planktothrix agardhii]MCF3576930.1 Maf-like protein [Planktothrix agardhii 1812]MCF3582951.1 Maf-like protein [Planktothrix agardhii 1811]MCF3623816.1 Maf-like protein [Planktothrix agardhii 1801]CAD5924857.1 Maf-like protein AM1_1059 [Planktothrix agardhii]
MNQPNRITFILASASPARKRLLETIGIQPIILKSDFDESQIADSNPVELVQKLAQCKAEVITQRLMNQPKNDGEILLVLGCDSVLAVGGEIYGKPANIEEAIARWQTMRGQLGQLYTGHALINVSTDQILVYSQTTNVYFANISDSEIKDYVDTGEPLNCAGCFAIEGKGGLFIEKLEGCHTNVIGLSLPLLRKMIQELGYNITNFW